MVSVDFRTRTDADQRRIGVEFFEHELPQRALRNADLVVRGARELRMQPLALVVDDRAWTLTFDGNHVAISAGDADAVTVWDLDAAGLDDLVNDVRTPMAFFTGGDLALRRGGLEDTLDWWVVLRALLDERPIHTTGAVTFDVDLRRSFTLEDDRKEMADFLADAGFLHLRGVYTATEMATVTRDMDDALPAYHPDDGQSWWARTADGELRAVRLDSFEARSPAAAALLKDERLDTIRRLTDDDHEFGDTELRGNVIEALIKPVGVVEGISDVPWHKDCSLGRHSYRCCAMTVGISVTGADATCGQLRVVAGSHRALIQPAFVRKQLDLPQIDLPTATGDVTVHLSCTMHMSEPPIERERRVMYTTFGLPDRAHDSRIGDANLRAIRDAAHKTVSQPPGHVSTVR
jgi:Phytanoyl-CoA dioxygenase (PhyH)